VENRKTLVVGIGEVGGPLADIVERVTPVLRHDLEPVVFDDPIGVMHVCIPFKSREQFEPAVLEYITRFKPVLTIINSTVVPGTTRSIAQQSGARVAYSPVRGKHARMREDMLRYNKFVAALNDHDATIAEDHFRTAGMKTRRIEKVETLELAKLAETTYFGIQIAFAQELNRLANGLGGDYNEAITFFDEVDFLPRTHYYPGFIGGHCVVPNILLLKQIARSPLFDAILESNDRRSAELTSEARNATSERRQRSQDAG
jgi:UDP-N-acetyl-D-mannosaminuronate dehydrogenase